MPQEENDLANVISGFFLGAFAGAGIGLGIMFCLLEAPLFFPGDTVLFGAITCGILGYYRGTRFIEWLTENWWWFWAWF